MQLSKRIESLLCFLCRASTVLPMLMEDVFALTFASAYVFILNLALIIIFLHLCTKIRQLIGMPRRSCGSLFRTFRLKSNSAGANPVVLCGVVL